MLTRTRNHTSYVYFVGFIAALAGLLFGFDTGIISGAITFITSEYHLTTEMEGFVVSSVLIGAVCGTLLSNIISRNFGRRKALIYAGILFTFGAIGSAFAPNPQILIIVRFFLGIAIGIASYTAPLYLAEISPKHIRGKIIAFYQLMIAAGLLAAYCSDMVFTPSGSWRWMLGIPAIPAAIMLISAAHLPHSPRWLMLKNKYSEAKQVLAKILPIDQAGIAFNEIEDRIQHDRLNRQGWRAIRSRKFRAVLILGVCLQMMQQWTGCNIVLYYAPIIFKSAGLATPIQQMCGTIAVGTTMLFATLIAVKYVDKWGRRPILFGSLAVMTISLGVLGLITGYSAHSIFLQNIAIISVLFYIAGFTISVGPVVWILCSEIFPIYARDFGIMITTAGNWVFNAMLAQVFPTLIAWLGNEVFYLFVTSCIVSFFFVKYFVPETKGVSLEQIEANLMSGKRTRYIGITNYDATFLIASRNQRKPESL
jgi:SP family galactose:H+ symporter-like MFS transporter